MNLNDDNTTVKNNIVFNPSISRRFSLLILLVRIFMNGDHSITPCVSIVVA